MDKSNIKWSTLLSEAVNKPGVISNCYKVFHNYSLGNQLLAWSQLAERNMELSPIATYKKWQELGRNVKKGEKALMLCMPVMINKKDDQGNKTEECFQAFTFKNNWFALDQTEGVDYANEVKTPEWNPELALNALNITQVKFDSANGNSQGYAIAKNIAINPVAQFPHKTRFHELAHVVLGHTVEHIMTDSEFTPKDTKEIEAESVAYILCSVLGLPGLEESRGYIQHWLEGNEISEKSAQKIFGTADKILKAGKSE